MDRVEGLALRLEQLERRMFRMEQNAMEYRRQINRIEMLMEKVVPFSESVGQWAQSVHNSLEYLEQAFPEIPFKPGKPPLTDDERTNYGAF